MIPLKKALTSSVGQKLIMGLSGVALVGFIITHVLGNLTLFAPGPTAFNTYAKNLHDFGALAVIGELGIGAVILVHAALAVRLKLNHAKARPVGYQLQESKNGPSHSNFSSRNMIITGGILLAFLLLHVIQFRFGPGIAEGYVTEIRGEKARDLHRLVSETFHKPLYVIIYAGVTLFLALHLRHGFWSAFQSLGAMNPRYSRSIKLTGVVLGIIASAAFLLMPFWFYFDLGK